MHPIVAIFVLLVLYAIIELVVSILKRQPFIVLGVVVTGVVMGLATLANQKSSRRILRDD